VHAGSGIRAGGGAARLTYGRSVRYPEARRLELVETLHGRPVADPYRWLEDPDGAETRAWSAAQDGLARRHLDSRPGRERLRRRLTELLDAGLVTVPLWRRDRAFWQRREPGQQHPVLLVRGGDGPERVLLDPGTLDPTGRTTLDAWEPSPDGRLLAYQLSEGGDEESALRVLDVDTGAVVDGPIDRTRYSPVAWRPDGTGFYYVRRLPPGEVPAGEEQFHRRVYRRRLGGGHPDELVFGAGRDPRSYYGVTVSVDGRWLTVSAAVGTEPRNDVYLADLAGDAGLRPVQEGVDARCSLHVGHDGRGYVLTDRDAARGRLAVIDPARPGRGRDLVPEDEEAVLTDYAVLTDAVVVGRARHAVAEVTVHDRDTGAVLDRVALPGLGALTGLTCRRDGGPDAWIGYTDHVTPPRVLQWSGGRLTGWADAPGAPPLPAVAARQESYACADGTTVRLTVLAPSAEPDRPRPTVLYGYGGFGVALEPAYSATALAWVEAGGVWAVAHLRGGTEEGEGWHRAGMREHKQRVFDDLHAAAEYLRGTGRADRLGIAGGSNGGLLVGAALTQRPELYDAVLCSAPLLDMVRYELFGLGRTWNDEYGSAADAEEFGWLLGYSPYHRVTPGTAYPPTLVTVFDSDTRVDPLHARKFVAALQHAQAAPEAPVLLRREADVGHGARSLARTVDLAVDTTAFLAHHLGLQLP
jgi:prolyl oligopeptidase